MFREVADRLFADMTEPGPAPAARRLPAERVRHANRAYYEAYLRNARMMAIIEQVATFNEEFREMRRRHRAASVGPLGAARSARWQRDGLVAADLDAEMAARALAAMVDHSLYLRLVQGDGDDTERFLDTLDALTVRALGLDRALRAARTEPPCTGTSPHGPVAAAEGAPGPPSLPSRLARAASGRGGAALAARLRRARVGLRRLSGGASRETWSFDADGRPLILRREPPAACDPPRWRARPRCSSPPPTPACRSPRWSTTATTWRAPPS